MNSVLRSGSRPAASQSAALSRADVVMSDVSALSLRLGEAGAESYLMACARAHHRMMALGEPQTIESRLLGLIGVEGGEPDAAIAARLSDDEIDINLLQRLIAANHVWPTDTPQG